MDIDIVDLYQDMFNSKKIIKLLEDNNIAADFYRALCNMQWRKINLLSSEDKIIDKLKGVETDLWSCSWRCSGGYIAEIRNSNYGTNEDYMDYYACGGEGTVSELVSEAFAELGWEPVQWE